MVDGLQNSVIESDVVPLDAPTGSKENFAGNGFHTQDTVLKVASEGGRDYSWENDRRWRIVNPGRRHYSTGKEVGYAVAIRGGATRLLARDDGWVGKRAPFARKAVWVVKDVEGKTGGRMWPAGKYVPQTREEPEDSVATWTNGEHSIENEDVLMYITVGECCAHMS